MAVNYYLRNYCHQSFYLLDENITPLQQLPQVDGTIEKQTKQKRLQD
jgi:hypothetical protein